MSEGEAPIEAVVRTYHKYVGILKYPRGARNREEFKQCLKYVKDVNKLLYRPDKYYRCLLGIYWPKGFYDTSNINKELVESIFPGVLAEVEAEA